MKGWKERVAKNKVAKAPKRRPRYGAVEQPTIVHSFDGIDGIHRSGGAVKIEPIEPSQKSTPESSPAPIKTTEPSIAIAAKAGKPQPREAWAVRMLARARNLDSDCGSCYDSDRLRVYGSCVTLGLLPSGMIPKMTESLVRR